MIKRSSSIFVLLVTLIAGRAVAGPPIVCHAIDIGSASSLPWSTAASWNGALSSYDVSKLSNDTLALLTPSTPAEVRMETLRRAAIYAMRSPAAGDDLARRLFARRSWFEAGYFIEALREAGSMVHRDAGPYVTAMLAGRATP